MFPVTETLTVELKSDRNKLSDNEIAEAVVCLANAEGGELWLGIEDDGRITGLHSSRAGIEGLPALIAGRTSPPVSVSVSEFDSDGRRVVRLTIRPSASEVCTTSGRYLGEGFDMTELQNALPCCLMSARLAQLASADRMRLDYQSTGRAWKISTRLNGKDCEGNCTLWRRSSIA